MVLGKEWKKDKKKKKMKDESKSGRTWSTIILYNDVVYINSVGTYVLSTNLNNDPPYIHSNTNGSTFALPC